MEAEVKAAGGVVWRDGDTGPLILVVHRPRQDDWSLPKGKLDPGEGWEACALREVEEETGLRCRLRGELASTSYRDARGRSKLVRYWLMDPVDGDFTPNREVDEVRWVTAEDAEGLLSYAHDRALVRESAGPAVSGATPRS